MNQFGGNWTENKIEILFEYAGAYLTIMKRYAELYSWKLLYFDGFAGSGEIEGNSKNEKPIVGASRRILQIDSPRHFDMYYFVEKDKAYSKKLEQNLKTEFPGKDIYVANSDCNEKIKNLGNWLNSSKGTFYKCLIYIDPCGMQLNWQSLILMSKKSVDLWVLVPTGMGISRLLKNNGEIKEGYVAKLETFLGMSKEEIMPYFYQTKKIQTLFGEESLVEKQKFAVEKSAILYEERLKTLFKYVTKPYILKNKNNSIMFHFFMASNNKDAVKIGNDIIKKYNYGTI